MRRQVAGCMFAAVAGLATACSAAPSREEVVAQSPKCVDHSAQAFKWDQTTPQGSGHLVRVFFLDASDTEPVRVMIDGTVVLDRPLETDTDGTGISGGLVCRLSGPVVFAFVTEGRETRQVLNIVSDEAKVVVHPTWPRIELVYGPLLLD
ncbi:MAG: hypothetical protein ACOH1E_09215 [Brevundimonas sp.]